MTLVQLLLFHVQIITMLEEVIIIVQCINELYLCDNGVNCELDPCYCTVCSWSKGWVKEGQTGETETILPLSPQ
jgi:hypothetical protein